MSSLILLGSLESLSLSLSPLRHVANLCLFIARHRDRLTDIWHCLLPVTVRYMDGPSVANVRYNIVMHLHNALVEAMRCDLPALIRFSRTLDAAFALSQRSTDSYR